MQKPILFPVNGLQGCRPLLRKLKLNLALSYKMDSTEPLMITAFADTLQLREVALSCVSTAEISLPWAQLTRLQCLEQTTVQCIQILHHTPHLETLSVCLGYMSEALLPLNPIRFDHLHTLKLFCTLNFLDKLACPSLICLNIEL
jgi:hypothetical protein